MRLFPGGQTMQLDVDPEDTVLSLKLRIQVRQPVPRGRGRPGPPPVLCLFGFTPVFLFFSECVLSSFGASVVVLLFSLPASLRQLFALLFLRSMFDSFSKHPCVRGMARPWAGHRCCCAFRPFFGSFLGFSDVFPGLWFCGRRPSADHRCSTVFFSV